MIPSLQGQKASVLSILRVVTPINLGDARKMTGADGAGVASLGQPLIAKPTANVASVSAVFGVGLIANATTMKAVI